MTGFTLNQPVTWRGEPGVIVGKTYADPRLYAIRTERGQTFSDVPERQISAPENVVAFPQEAGA